MKISCYCSKLPKAPLEKYEYESKPLGSMDVMIKITHCGICHSDVHIVDGDWGNVSPAVPGHEIIGAVSEIGKDVKTLKIGDRVGVGWLKDTCNSCEYCYTGQESLCSNRTPTCFRSFGGFANFIRVNSKFAIPIPKNLDSAKAAPLLCGGTTMYSPLRRFAKPWMKVGIIGVGGLGHLGIQFANKFGCEVVAFSSNPNKEKEAKEFGAHHFVSSTNKEELKKHENSLDLILSTVHSNLDWLSYVNILRRNGTLCFLGVFPEKIKGITSDLLVTTQKKITGSTTGGIPIIKEMLEFSSRHNIGAKVQEMPMEKANEALNITRENKAKYRVVLKA